jgi:hypothetical protein
MPGRLGTVLLVAIGIINPSHAASVLKTEPPMGALKENEVVLVDDGSYPAGQIKRIVSGNHVKVGGNKHIVRTRECVPR